MTTSSVTPASAPLHYDVAVVGGGPAGLAAAVALARSLRSVVVIDAGAPRNAPAHAAHNLLGREGISPLELLRTGREEALAYGAEVRDGLVAHATRSDGGFTLTLEDGAGIRARRIVLATGLVDVLPDIPGVREHWGTDVLHCPYCHGYEVRGQRLVVLGTSVMSAHQSLLFAHLAHQVTLVLTDPTLLDDAEERRLRAVGVEIVAAGIERIVDHEVDGERRVSGVAVDDGRVIPADAVVVAPRFEARGDLFEQLGGTLTDHPMGRVIETGPMGQTAVEGVWAPGNASDLSAMVTVSAGAGLMAGAAINAELVMLEADHRADHRTDHRADHQADHQGKSSGVASSTTRADAAATETTSPTAS